MKAIIAKKYGLPEGLELAEIEKPVAMDNEILIRVHAAAVNPVDSHTLKGKPVILRLLTGLRKPKNTHPGVDLAGVVEAVGKDVTDFKPGDEIFGARNGAFAEYVCTQGKAIAPKPANLSFEQAAAVPVAAFTALQGLRDKGNIQPGSKVLINGASGGVGTFAVQIAKALGGEVTAVCSTRNAEQAGRLGADRVIDYSKEDFSRSGEKYDLIFDSIGNRSLSVFQRLLRPQGTYVMVGGPISHLMWGILASRFVKQSVFFIAVSNRSDLLVMTDLIEAGKVIPVIDRRYTLEQAPEAVHYMAEGHARGKIIITIVDDSHETRNVG